MSMKVRRTGLWPLGMVFCCLMLPAALAARPMEPAGPKKGEEAVSENTKAAYQYQRGDTAVTEGDFSTARSHFEKANDLDPDNPEILNMLAYTQRKTGDIDTAIANYKRALELRPEFPEAREYLGEAYVQAALRELATLKSYGPEARHEAEELSETIRKAADEL